jgi:hypothetical protein
MKQSILAGAIIFLVNLGLYAQNGSETVKTRFEFKNEATKQEIDIPEVGEINRFKPGVKPTKRESGNTCFVMQPETHKVDGNEYVILTDHTDKEYLSSLKLLAKHREGKIIETTNLASLYLQAEEVERIKRELKDVKYIALAPRMESYTENMLLGFYKLICNLDNDPDLDAYPGVLLASGANEFEELIERTINYTAIQQSDFSLMACCMVPNNKELRSLQKNGILHNMFLHYGLDIPMLNVYEENATEAPDLVDSKAYRMEFKRKKFIKEFPKDVEDTFKNSSMLIFHGHGLPGASCGIANEAIPEKIETDIVLLGSCFSASTQTSDITPVKISPDGYKVVPKKSFAIDLIDKGATVVMGHMRLNAGFPRLFPVLETFMDGRTVGEAYQELVNTSIVSGNFNTSGLALRSKPENPRRVKQNGLLYILFGDPALRPLKKFAATN